MSHDDFEKRMQRLPLRQLPPEWREDILRTAGLAHRATSEAPARPGFFARLSRQLSTQLWLQPKAWAALATVWIAIAAMHFYCADKPTTTARKVSPPTPELMVVLHNQRRELARLVQPADSSDTEPSKSSSPGPRSERRSAILAV
jgi:hypothetical protein